MDWVTSAVLVLMGGGKIPKDLSWGAAKKMMNNVDQFLKSLQDYDKDNTPDVACTYCETNFISLPDFTAEKMKTKSGAAAGMTSWVINICKYFRYSILDTDPFVY